MSAHLGISLEHLLDILVAAVLPEPRRQLLQLSEQRVQLLSELARLHAQPRLLLQLVQLLPDLTQLRPHALWISGQGVNQENKRSYGDEINNTALMVLAQKTHLTAILCFLKVGFKVGLRSGLGFTAFSVKKL